MSEDTQAYGDEGVETYTQEIEETSNTQEAYQKPNLFQRIVAIMREVKYIQKDTRVNTGRESYPAVTHDRVAATLHPALAKHGIVVMPSLLESETKEGQTKNGMAKIRYSGKYHITFINSDNPDEQYSMIMEGHADDMGDKAPGKALSYAVKMALLKAFALETGENDETVIDHNDGVGNGDSNQPHYPQAAQPRNNGGSHKSGLIDKQSVERIKSLAEQSGTPIKTITNYCRVQVVEHMSDEQGRMAIQRLENKLSKSKQDREAQQETTESVGA